MTQLGQPGIYLSTKTTKKDTYAPKAWFFLCVCVGREVPLAVVYFDFPGAEARFVFDALSYLLARRARLNGRTGWQDHNAPAPSSKLLHI